MPVNHLLTFNKLVLSENSLTTLFGTWYPISLIDKNCKDSRVMWHILHISYLHRNQQWILRKDLLILIPTGQVIFKPMVVIINHYFELVLINIVLTVNNCRAWLAERFVGHRRTVDVKVLTSRASVRHSMSILCYDATHAASDPSANRATTCHNPNFNVDFKPNLKRNLSRKNERSSSYSRESGYRSDGILLGAVHSAELPACRNHGIGASWQRRVDGDSDSMLNARRLDALDNGYIHPLIMYCSHN